MLIGIIQVIMQTASDNIVLYALITRVALVSLVMFRFSLSASGQSYISIDDGISASCYFLLLRCSA